MTRENSGLGGEKKNSFHEEARGNLKNFYIRYGIQNMSYLAYFDESRVSTDKDLNDNDKGTLMMLILMAKAEEAKRRAEDEMERSMAKAEYELKKLKIEGENFAKKALAEEAAAKRIKAENEKACIAAPVCDFCGESDCAGHPHSNWDVDTNFPSDADVRKYGFVEVPYLDKAGLSELTRFRIFVRDEAFRLFQELEQKTNIQIHGSPGVGKSITVWLWALIQARRHNKTVRWIHLGKKDCNVIMEFDASGYKAISCKKSNDSLIVECKTNIIVVDGMSEDSAYERRQCSVLERSKELYPCHIIMFYMAGWTLSEYKTACEDDTLWRSVEAKGFGPLVKQIVYDPNYPRKHAFIANKFFYAGSCARYFFYQTVTSIKESVRNAFDKISDKADLNSDSIGIKWLAALNTIMAGCGGRYTFVSDYAFIICSQDYSQYVRGLEYSVIARIGNRTCYGIYYEHIFLKCLGDKEMKSPLVPLVPKEGGIIWKFDLPIVFLDTFIAAMRLSDVSIYLSWVYDDCKKCPAKVPDSNQNAEKTRCNGRVDHEYKTLTDLRKHMTDHHGWNFAENAKNGWGNEKSLNYFKPDDPKIYQARNEYLSMFESPGRLQPADGEIQIGQWLIPSRFNNEGFDCIFRESQSTLVLVQITISKTHSMKMGAFVRIAEYVRMKYPEITTAKIAYIVPSTVSNYRGLAEASSKYKGDLGEIDIRVEGTKSIYQFHPVEADRFLCST